MCYQHSLFNFQQNLYEKLNNWRRGWDYSGLLETVEVIYCGYWLKKNFFLSAVSRKSQDVNA